MKKIKNNFRKLKEKERRERDHKIRAYDLAEKNLKPITEKLTVEVDFSVKIGISIQIAAVYANIWMDPPFSEKEVSAFTRRIKKMREEGFKCSLIREGMNVRLPDGTFKERLECSIKLATI